MDKEKDEKGLNSKKNQVKEKEMENDEKEKERE